MGSSGWEVRGRFRLSLNQTLSDLQNALLSSGDFEWPWDDDEEGPPRPRTLEELRKAKQIEDFWDSGTHSVLDMETVVEERPPSGYGDFGDGIGTVWPLEPDECQDLFGGARATLLTLDGLCADGASSALQDLVLGVWTGRCLVAYDDNSRPQGVLFWGISGD